jgi:hypothetical protein
MRRVLSKYLNPWGFRRHEQERRLAELRRRDGDDCRRCRRPIRFDLPAGHELGAKVEQFRPGSEALENLCLTHGRCNAKDADHTDVVRERLRPKREAELFTKARKTRRRAA